MMAADFISLTAENLADEHLCCIIRSKKRQWLSVRLKEGRFFYSSSFRESGQHKKRPG